MLLGNLNVNWFLSWLNQVCIGGRYRRGNTVISGRRAWRWEHRFGDMKLLSTRSVNQSRSENPATRISSGKSRHRGGLVCLTSSACCCVLIPLTPRFSACFHYARYDSLCAIVGWRLVCWSDTPLYYHWKNIDSQKRESRPSVASPPVQIGRWSFSSDQRREAGRVSICRGRVVKIGKQIKHCGILFPIISLYPRLSLAIQFQALQMQNPSSKLKISCLF